MRQIAFERPRVHRLPAALFYGAERKPFAARPNAKFFFELDLRAIEQLFVGRRFAFRDRPHAFVLPRPKRAARMRE